MRVHAVVNQKGGSGKTTTAVNLAGALAEKRKKVLLVDLDPQANASTWLGVRDAGKDLLEVFAGERDLADAVRATEVLGLDIVPSSSWLVGAEEVMADAERPEGILRHELETLPAEGWDYILLDCPPALGRLSVNALAAAQEALVPVEAHVLALEGLAQLLQTIDTIKARVNPELEITGVLACRVDFRNLHTQQVVKALRDRFKRLVYKTVIRENVRLAECPGFAQTIFQYAPSSRGSEDYEALAKEFIRRGRRN